MKSAFRGYYPPSPDELDKLWTEGLIVFDANALLNFFRYSAVTRDELLKLLRNHQEQLWIPHQVGLEFHRNRHSVREVVDRWLTGVDQVVREREEALVNVIRSLKSNAALEADELLELVEKQAKKFKRKLKRARRDHRDEVTSDDAHAATLAEISELYDGRVGEPYSEERLQEIYSEGADRYAKKIPPGYMDAKTKDGDEKYGDLVLWHQLLEHAAEIKRPVIFVTDDAKEDWWEKSSGRTVGPRPELVETYYETTGERLHLYGVRRFLAYAEQRGADISETALAEAREVQASAIEAAFSRRASEALSDAARRYWDLASGSASGSALARFADLVSSVEYSPATRAHMDAIGHAARGLMAEHPGLSSAQTLAFQDAYWKALRDRQATGIAASGLADERRQALAEAYLSGITYTKEHGTAAPDLPDDPDGHEGSDDDQV